jgi:hypothetical protein
MEISMQYKSREELQKIFVDHFIENNEVYAVYFFGREVDGKADQYSDIDIIICSNDLLRTWTAYPHLLQNIAPIMGRLLLESSETSFAEMILLEGWSPYQKIDLSIVGNIACKDAFGPFKQIYKKNGVETVSRTTLPVTPRIRDIHLELSDNLFSVPRFTKCLFRKDFDMYRRWKGTTNHLLVLLYEKYFGWQHETIAQQLKAHEAKHLYEKLTAADNERLQSVFPINGQFNLAISYQNCVVFFVDLMKHKSHDLGLRIQESFADLICTFLHDEVEKYLSI